MNIKSKHAKNHDEEEGNDGKLKAKKTVKINDSAAEMVSS